MSDDISQILGRIDGKLDQVIEASKEHREDDIRRFTDVYKVLSDHSEDINKAKGAKGALMLAAGAISAVVAALGGYLMKALGIH